MGSLSCAQETASLAPVDAPVLSSEQAAVILAALHSAAKSLDPDETIGEILNLLSERLGLKDGRVVQADPETGRLYTTYAHGLPARKVADGAYPGSEGVIGHVMATGEAACVSDSGRKAAPAGHRSSHDSSRVGSTRLAAPILQHDACTGVLVVEHEDRERSHTTGDMYMLQTMAAVIGNVLRLHGAAAEDSGRLMRRRERSRLDRSMDDAAVHGIVGQSPALRRALNDAQKAASSQAAVLLIGESGCGKERFARMIHLASARRDKPFVCINCAAIPPNLLEAELFGYEKGSFTGATAAHKGKFEIAAGGTLFLDEIGDMTSDLQAKLLRVLQEKVVQRIGSNEEVPVDVRIISATNKQLEGAVKVGEFRLDLYYRLNVVPISLPPLRERDGDIELLALYFLARYNQQHHRNVVFARETLQRLEAYDWPGNVRQLENVIERLVIMSDAESIGGEEIDRILGMETGITLDALENEKGNSKDKDSSRAPRSYSAESFKPYKRVHSGERAIILEALRESSGNKTHAARRLGLSPRQLYYRLAKLQIDD